MKEADDAKVGYAKPPRHSQFKKGRSGNARGRPKGSKNLATLLRQAIAERVRITENGQHRSITKLEASIKQLVNRAASADPKATQQVIALTQWLEGNAQELQSSADALTDADREVIALIHARLKKHDGDNNE